MTARFSPTLPTSTTLTETVDLRRGHIRASGHLTRQGADLLSGTADQLRVNGHVRVVLDLQGVRVADTAGLDTLTRLRSSFAADGGELVIRNLPQQGPRP